MTKTAGDLWQTSRVRGSVGGKLLRGGIEGGKFLLNWPNRILAKRG